MEEPTEPEKTMSADKGKRYTQEERDEIIAFIEAYDKENGRGGATKAAVKYLSLIHI